MNRPLANRRRGIAFTLIEVLLAISIFSMVLAALYTTWSAIMRGTKSAQEAATAVQRSRVAVRAIEDALHTVQIYAGSPNLYWFVAETKGEFASLDLVAKLPESFPGSGLFGEQRLRHVSFTVEPGDFSRNELKLKQWALLTPPSLGPEAAPYEIVLGRDVDLFKLEFWDLTAKKWVEEWNQTNNFPALVKVAIGMANKEGLPADKREIITRIIAPAAIVVPREYQVPGVPLMPGRPANAPLPGSPGFVMPPPQPLQ